MSRGTLVLIAALLLAVLAMTLAFILWTGSAERPEGDTDQQVIPFDEPGRWSPEIADGKQPVLVRAPAPGDIKISSNTPGVDLKAFLEGKSLGQLEGEDLEHLIQATEQYYQDNKKRVKEHQDELDPASAKDLTKEADLLYSRESSLAVRNAVFEGSYFAVTQETLNTIVSPLDSSMVTMGGIKKDGQGVIIIVISPFEEHPVLARAKQSQIVALKNEVAETVWNFNAQDYSARKAQIDRYSEIRNKKKRSYEDNEFIDSTFPTGAKLNRRTLLLSIRR